MSPKPPGGPGTTDAGVPHRKPLRELRTWGPSARLLAARFFGRRGQRMLVARVAILSLLVIAIVLAGTLWFIQRDARQDARDGVVASTALMATAVVNEALVPNDLVSVSEDRRHTLDLLFNSSVLLGGALQAEIIGRDGRVTYATSAVTIDPAVRDGLARQALAGEAVTGMGHLVDHRGARGAQVVLAAVPLRIREGGTAPAVLVVAEDYGPIAAETREQITRIGFAAFMALLLLYVAILPVLAGTSRRLRRQSDENEHQAMHDSLTGLPNRALFRDRVRQATLAARREGQKFTVVALDLDRFKEVNDALGQKTGDELLRQVGQRLTACLRESDTVARLGGDQFGLLLPGVGTSAGAVRVAGMILNGVGEAFDLEEMSVTLEISTGGAIFPDHGEDEDTLIQHADVARRSAKSAHAGLVVYTPDLDKDSVRRLALAGDLRRAITGGELVVHYQPKIHLVTGRVRGFEALVRWNHPERGLLGPDEFVHIAEATGLIRPLTLEVLDTALRQCAKWRSEGCAVDVAVNLSVQHLLDDGLPADVSSLLLRHRLPAEALELEITEGTIMSNPRRAREVLIALSDMGVRIAIDDFGVGYSSLAYLSELPVDVLKIDRSFVLKMAESGHEAMIVRTTIDLGHNLGLEVVAEGVETAEMATLLLQGGCDLAQGYHFSRPLPAADLGKILQASGSLQAVMSQPDA
jgi:diguanylate cyclase (GGDEF)-like protein